VCVCVWGGGNGNGGSRKRTEEGCGGSLGRARRRARGVRKEKRARRLALLKWRRARQGRGEGPRVQHRMEERTTREGGRVPTGGGQRGRHGNGPAVVWPRRAADRTGEGEGGLIGGQRP
jgi:hypothetical protein